jgi:predicted PurR-regulated permease PerM
MDIQPSAQLQEWNFRRVVGATLTLAMVAIAFWLLYLFNQVVFILFIAIVIGTVIRPVVVWLYRRGVPRIAGVIIVYLLLLALLIGFLLLLFPLIAEQSITIAAALPGNYQSLHDWMVNNSSQLIVGLGRFLPLTYAGLSGVQLTGQGILNSAGQALSLVNGITQFAFYSAIILILAFHWTLDGPRSIQSLLQLIPQDQRQSSQELILAMEGKVSGYVAGQGILCLAIGAMALAVYLLIGLPNALVLALIALVLEAVPVIGPLLGAIPAAMIALTLGPDRLVWVIVGTVIIQQVENSVLAPRIMHKTVGVNPFVSLLAFFAFSSLLGLPGAFMAIPMAAILQLLLDRFLFGPGAMEAEVSTGRDYVSRLRYEAQTLARNLQKQARLKKGGSDQRVKQTDQLMDEIETITTDLDALLAQSEPQAAP